MIITNKFNLPKHLYDILAKDEYDPGESDYTVTGLIDSPRVLQLKQRHGDEIIMDVSEMIWSLFGNSLHGYLADRAPDRCISEVRYFREIFGKKVSGQIDLWDDGTLFDYKCTSVWSVIFKSKYALWEQQLNTYAYLMGIEPEKLIISAFFRDWMEGKKNQHDYPDANVQMIEFPVWKPGVARSFIAKRVALHMKNERKSDDELTLCTPEEMWARATTYAIMKNKNIRATKVCNDVAAASTHLSYYRDKDPKNKYKVEERPGVCVRCEKNFCKVVEYCNQYKEYINGRAMGRE